VTVSSLLVSQWCERKRCVRHLQTADALVSNGMAGLGYKYVVVDDCWVRSQLTGIVTARALVAHSAS
jgi:hypothetical protein